MILPDTADLRSNDTTQVVAVAERAVWKANAGLNPAPVQAALDDRSAQRDAEDARLLYVAMTRAESWLIVAGAGDMKKPDNWYNRVAEGLRLAGTEWLATPTGAGFAPCAWDLARTRRWHPF